MQDRAKWVIHCDDMGMHPCIDLAIADLLASGPVCSLSLMSVGNSFSHAVAQLKSIGWKKVGVHLCLTSEYESLPVRPLTTEGQRLASESGVFFPHANQIPHAFNKKDAERELRAQIERILDCGLEITHLDGHMMFYESQIVGHDLFLEIVSGLAKEQQCSIRGMVKSNPKITSHMIWEGYDTREERFTFYEELLQNCRFGTHELILHPALSDERQLKTFTGAGQRRIADYLFLKSIMDTGLLAPSQICGWKDLPSC